MGERIYLVTLPQLEAEVAKAIEESQTAGIPFSQKGTADGVATLDGSGAVPAGELGHADPAGAAATVAAEVIGTDPATKAPAIGGGSVPLLSSVVSSSRPESFGCAGNGVTNDTADFQKAMNETKTGGVLYCQGKYLITAPLTIPASLGGIFLEEGCQIIKAFTGTLFKNQNTAVALSGLSVTGPGEIFTNTSLYEGGYFQLWGNELTFDDFVTNGIGGQFMVLVGNIIQVGAVKALNPLHKTGVAGIRYAGGSNFSCVGAHIESGDDCLQMVPIDPEDITKYHSWFPVMSITDAVFAACTGFSTNGNFMAAILGNGGSTEPGEMTSAVSGSWIGCKGLGGFFGISAVNSNSSGTVHMTTTDCELNMENGLGTATADVRATIGADAGTGTVVVRHKRLTVLNPKGTNHTVEASSSSAEPLSLVELDDCDMGALATASSMVDITAATRVQISKGRYDMKGMAAGAKGILLGSSTNPVENADVGDDVAILNIPNKNSSYGIVFVNVKGGSLTHARPASIAEATEGRAVLIEAQCSKIKIKDNDVSAIAGSQPIVNEATDTIVQDNIGVTGFQSKSANYTTLAPDIAVEVPSTATTAFTVTMTGFYIGQRLALINNTTHAACVVTAAAASGAVNGIKALGKGQFATYMWDGTNWNAIGATPPVGEQLLVRVQYAESKTYETKVTAAAAIDSTNLTTPPFVAPASGDVLVKLEGKLSAAGGGLIAAMLFKHGTTEQVGPAGIITASTTLLQLPMTILVTGLTPGETYQFDWAWAISGGGTATMKTGKAESPWTSDLAPATMEVWAA